MLRIVPIPAFSDNYIWLILNENTAAAVDPGDGLATHNYLKTHNIKLSHILITHDHSDHTGGIDYLKNHYNVEVFGPKSSKLTNLNKRLCNGDQVIIFDTIFDVISAQGHTQEHIIYFHKNPKNPILFSGDVLFSAGCGRIFEGTPVQMFESLSKIKSLPLNTLIYPAHEYSLSNLDFAAFVEPDNPIINDTKILYTQKRIQSIPTLPTTLSLELKINPFLRTDSTSIRETIKKSQSKSVKKEQDVFTILRHMKDKF